MSTSNEQTPSNHDQKWKEHFPFDEALAQVVKTPQKSKSATR